MYTFLCHGILFYNIIFKDYVVFHDIDKLLSIQQMLIVSHRMLPTLGIINNCVLNIIAEEALCLSMIVFGGFIPRNGTATSRNMNQIWGYIDQDHLLYGLYILRERITIYFLWRWACVCPTSRTTVGITIFKKPFPIL